MKHRHHLVLTVTATIAAYAAAAASATTVFSGASTPTLHPQPAASGPLLERRPDLIADVPGWQFAIRVRNVGTANSPPSITRVTCTAVVSPIPNATQVPCVEGTHFVTVPAIQLPAGTTKMGANVWNVPTGGLDALTGTTTFSVNIKTTPAQRPRGLNFMVCADAPAAIPELRETNNCQGFNYTWPS